MPRSKKPSRRPEAITTAKWWSKYLKGKVGEQERLAFEIFIADVVEYESKTGRQGTCGSYAN